MARGRWAGLTLVETMVALTLMATVMLGFISTFIQSRRITESSILPAAATADASSVGAVDNFIGAIPLSTVTGTTSQQINLNLWVWIDEIPSGDASEVKKVTVVYTYSYMDGSTERFVRDREVFLRTRYDQ